MVTMNSTIKIQYEDLLHADEDVILCKGLDPQQHGQGACHC